MNLIVEHKKVLLEESLTLTIEDIICIDYIYKSRYNAYLQIVTNSNIQYDGSINYKYIKLIFNNGKTSKNKILKINCVNERYDFPLNKNLVNKKTINAKHFVIQYDIKKQIRN